MFPAHGQICLKLSTKHEEFFATNQGPTNILGRMDFHPDDCYFCEFLDSRFLDFQIPRCSDSRPSAGWHVLWPTGLRSHLDQIKKCWFSLMETDAGAVSEQSTVKTINVWALGEQFTIVKIDVWAVSDLFITVQIDVWVVNDPFTNVQIGHVWAVSNLLTL